MKNGGGAKKNISVTQTSLLELIEEAASNPEVNEFYLNGMGWPLPWEQDKYEALLRRKHE